MKTWIIERGYERSRSSMKALPDKGGVYSAALSVHALVWAAILSTLTVTNNPLNVFGAFKL